MILGLFGACHVTPRSPPLPTSEHFSQKISLWKQTINHHPRATTRLKLTENSELYLPRDSPLSHKAPQEFSGSFGKINCRSVSQTNKSQQTAVLITQGETNRTPRSKPPNLSVSGRRSTDKPWHNKYKYHKDKSFIKRKRREKKQVFRTSLSPSTGTFSRSFSPFSKFLSLRAACRGRS